MSNAALRSCSFPPDLAGCVRNHRQVLPSQGGQQFGVLVIHLAQLEQQGGKFEAAQQVLLPPIIHVALAQELELIHFTTGKAKLHQVQQHQRWFHGGGR